MNFKERKYIRMEKIKIIVTVLLLCASLIAVPVGSRAAAGEAAGLVNTASTALNVRSSPSAASEKITSLAKNSYVTLVERSGDWWKVEYADGQYGYCSDSYIYETDAYAAYVRTDGGSLNVRTGAGTTYTVKDRIANGEELFVLWKTGSWSKVLYNGTSTGYVYSSYLGTSETKTDAGTETDNAISLDVPSYKQLDSRWKNVTLGSSGKTVGTSGCTTTCIAMAESCLQGYTITPGTMAKTLTYDSSGNLYWPTGYYAYTASNYLTKIYSELQNGRPVLVGSKTYSGGQHWVLVTGFTGGSITTSSFVINDPGVSSRSTLAAFFSDYPVFYKIVYINK